MAEPFPKSSQLARGERRYRRKVASPKQWAAIRAEKGDVCRLDQLAIPLVQYNHLIVQYHHLLSRAQGGDDVADNLVPLCWACHTQVTRRNPKWLPLLAVNLTDGEYAYVVGKLGEGAMGRLFGV